MSIETRLNFYNSFELSLPETLHWLLVAFNTNGFKVSKIMVGNYPQLVIDWIDFDLEADVRLLEIAYEQSQLSFTIMSETEDFGLLIQIYWGTAHFGQPNRSFVSAVSNQSLYSELIVADYYSRIFLDFGKLVFAVLHPSYGWIEMTDPTGYESFDDVDSLIPRNIYWANFFSKEFVESIGRQRLLSAPNWSIEELADDGLLYVLSSCPGLVSQKSLSIETIKSYWSEFLVRGN